MLLDHYYFGSSLSLTLLQFHYYQPQWIQQPCFSRFIRLNVNLHPPHSQVAVEVRNARHDGWGTSELQSWPCSRLLGWQRVGREKKTRPLYSGEPNVQGPLARCVTTHTHTRLYPDSTVLHCVCVSVCWTLVTFTVRNACTHTHTPLPLLSDTLLRYRVYASVCVCVKQNFQFQFCVDRLHDNEFKGEPPQGHLSV